jgi:hypothetical protein
MTMQAPSRLPAPGWVALGRALTAITAKATTGVLKRIYTPQLVSAPAPAVDYSRRDDAQDDWHARKLLAHLPAETRNKATWQYVVAQLDEAARGADVIHLVVPLWLAFAMVGVACRPK